MRVVYRRKAVTDVDLIEFLKERGYKFFWEYDRNNEGEYSRCIINIACTDRNKTLLIEFEKDKADPDDYRLYNVERRYIDMTYNDCLDSSIYAVKIADNEVHTWPGSILYS